MRLYLHTFTIGAALTLGALSAGHAQQPQDSLTLEQHLRRADAELSEVQRRFADGSLQVQVATLRRDLWAERLHHALELVVVRAEADQHALEYRFGSDSPQVKAAATRVEAARQALCAATPVAEGCQPTEHN